MEKVLIAMSGGVDSGVAVHLLKQAGYDCVGGMMQLFSGAQGAEKAAAAAKRMGIPFHLFHMEEDFSRRVIMPFCQSYREGLTPNPCILCNREMKFGLLLQKALELGCTKLATGHYARIARLGDRYAVRKAADPAKDQSYVLCSLTQEQLSRVIFPLGDLTKAEVRGLAGEFVPEAAGGKESQDICFVPDGDYAAVIARVTGDSGTPGDVTDPDGAVLGRHRGIMHYTVGQRKGLGLALKEPMYVLSKDPVQNRVVLGRNEQLMRRELFARDFNWMAVEEPSAPILCRARTRYNQPEQPATVTPLENGRVQVVFDSPVRAITPGQRVVLYDGDIVLGGGIIE